MGALAIATASVEKNALGQETIDLGTDIGSYQRHNQGTLADSLMQGEITEEVKNLRWRILKVLDASDNYIVTTMGFDDDGYPIMDTEQPNAVGQKVLLAKVKMDKHDDYPLELVVDNKTITMGSNDAMDNEHIGAYGLEEIKKSIKKDDDGNATQATLGEVDGERLQSSMKDDKPVKVVRDSRAKFEIENYTKKLNVRKINAKERLLEFYISIYPDEYDRKTRFLIQEIKKAIINPRSSDMLDIVGVGFTSYKTVGVKDFRQFQYMITGFDKIIEYNGYYVIKFKADVIVDGDYLLEKYRMEELDNKYKNKEAKN